MFKKSLTAVHSRFIFITKSLITRSLWRVSPTSGFDNFGAKERRRLWIVSAFSIFRNRFSFWRKGNYIQLFNIWSRGYYHWLTETAIKFVLFETEIRKAIIVIPENPPPFILDFLSVMQIENVREMKGTCLINRVILTDNPVSGHPNPDHILQLRMKILERIQPDSAAPKRIYISRRLANQRKVANETILWDMLRGNGFIYIELERLPWTEQVNLFRKCELLVSIHGAGLSNCIFMPPGTKVIEIFPALPGGPNPCFSTLCSTVGVKHEFYFAERESKNDEPDFHKDNLIVNVAEFSRRIVL